MAALTPAQVELASSLAQDDLPTKLKCAICNKLAVNAFRLPCCETAICENCQSILPSSCPVCEHSPLSGNDCTVYKSLRTTIRVFLKTEEKKREAARPKTNGSAPPTPVVADTPVEPTFPDTEALANEDNAIPNPEVEPQYTNAEATDETSNVESHNDSQSHQVGSVPGASQNQPAVDENDPALEPGQANNGNTEQSVEAQDDAEGQDFGDQSGQGFEDEPSMNGEFNGMNFNGGDMNPMQFQMMMMQNGMNPAAFGGFPMMGMGMNMDPSAMQNLYMNGGFGAQGMGMNGMNMMNMGMNSFNGGGNDWNDQQSWQDNFNPNASGMANGDFGNFNSRFEGSYNQGNYAQNQYNNYGRGGWQYRGRGRGRGYYNRGGFGRGGYNPSFNPRHQGQQMWDQETNHQSENAQPGGSEVSVQAQATTGTDTDEFGRRIRQEGQEEDSLEGQNGGKQEGDDGQGNGDHDAQVPTDNASGEAHDDSAMVNGDVSSADPYPRSHGSLHGSGTMSSAAPSAPLNAPTGPKAMRQGLPNTSSLHLRARGFIQDQSVAGDNSIAVTQSPLQEERPPSPGSSRHSQKDASYSRSGIDKDHEHQHEVRSQKHDGDQGRSRSQSRSRSRSHGRNPSRSRDHKESRRHRRHRSETISDDGRDDDGRRRKHRSKRSFRDDDHKVRSKDDKHDERSRSASPDRDREHRRSSHRSHRDRDRERDRERDSDRDHRKKSSHRSHHDHNRERERERDRDRERRKERDREREHRHRSSRRTSTEPPTPIEPAEKDFNPPTGPRGSSNNASVNAKSEFSIKGASSKTKTSSATSHRRESEISSSRRESQVSTSNAPKGTPSGPAKDPHTLEREKRDRERLLKEAQRMAGLTGMTGMKRGRDAGDERAGRRKNRRSDAIYGEGEEQRMRRLEAEREGGRWD